MLQHCTQLRLAATEAFEQFHQLLKTVTGKDIIEERLSDLMVENPFILEAKEGVCCQYVYPQIVVVTHCVATSENMAEGMRGAAPYWARHRGDLFFSFCQRLEDFNSLLRTKLRMQTKVEQIEF